MTLIIFTIPYPLLMSGDFLKNFKNIIYIDIETNGGDFTPVTSLQLQHMMEKLVLYKRRELDDFIEDIITIKF